MLWYECIVFAVPTVMETRRDSKAAAAKGASESEDWYLGKLLLDLEPKQGSPLPTAGDALRHYLSLKRGSHLLDKKDVVIKIVVKRVQAFWEDAGIPSLKHPANKPKRQLEKLLVQFETIKKNIRYPKRYEADCKSFDANCGKLLEMAHPHVEHLIKTCTFRSAAKKVEDLTFLKDQRTTRLLGIGSLDKKYAKQIQDKQKRLQAAEDRKLKELSSRTLVSTIPTVATIPPDCESDGSSTDSSDEYIPPPQRRKTNESTEEPKLNLLKSPDFHILSDRFKVPHSARFAIAAVAEE